MTFAEAMEKSRELELAAWRAIALRLSEQAQRDAVSAHIKFNPFRYALAPDGQSQKPD